ncbi:helix-turn-helix transcriptional regulator [Ramlibacter sp. WS9]|uniref:helix-turn-helix transcriptional regulator n=1 Tax=Ramlibacter sp. WS9 TaxID=1882741 RepID=UPI0013052F5B|nr:helix-turn-helix transcriptional regulator [Ramlibacter sp. WS9]
MDQVDALEPLLAHASIQGPEEPPDAGQLSALLLHLYEAARATGVAEFQRQAMELVARYLPHDGCWWGRATFDGDQHRVHCSYLHGLPEDVPQRLNTTDPQNVVARTTTKTPNRTHQFGLRELAAEPATEALTAHMGISQSLCIAHVENATGQMNFVSVVRREEVPLFNAGERQLLEWLMPHLAAALDVCCAQRMASLRTGADSALLTTDMDGWVHVSEPAVAALLQREWAGWSGPRLPSGLSETLVRPPHRFLGRRVQAEAEWAGEHLIVMVRPRKPVDLLTAQERAVAEAFSAGRPYKEVAEMLKLAPTTVRHHLRNVYLKLGVGDKGALARALAG